MYHVTKRMLFLKKVEPERVRQQVEHKQAVLEEVKEYQMLHTLQTQDQGLRPGQGQPTMPCFDTKQTKESIVQR